MIPARGRRSSSSNWFEDLTRLVPQGEHATSHQERSPCQRTKACARSCALRLAVEIRALLPKLRPNAPANYIAYEQ